MAAEDNWERVWAMFNAAVTAEVYDADTGEWSGPVVPESPTAYVLTYSTAADTVPAATAVAVATTGSTVTTPYGYTTQAQADAIPVAINANAADTLAVKKVVVALINSLVAAGLATS